MKKWEYLAVYYESTIHEDVLTQLGNQGWELVTVLIRKGETSTPRWIFKKEKEVIQLNK